MGLLYLYLYKQQRKFNKINNPDYFNYQQREKLKYLPDKLFLSKTKFHSLNATASLVKKCGKGIVVHLLLSEVFLLYFLRMASVINPELHFYRPCTFPLFRSRIIKEQNNFKPVFCAA
jgi:hypothetical protein